MTSALLAQDLLTGCLYGRNSDGQEKSIEDQLAEGRADAAAEGITIPDEYVYSDGTSASWYGKKTRDDWARVLADIEHRRWDVLCLWEPSRGDRSPESWAYMIRRCREQGILIRIIRDEETLDPRRAGHLKRLLQDGLDSLFESVKTSERVQKGIRGAVERGTPLGRVTFGYRRTRGDDGKVTGQVPNEFAPVVREVFDRLARGVPLSHVTRWLNTEGYRTPTGKPFGNGHVRDIARTPTYIGHRYGPDGDLVKGAWPAIVDEDVWYQVKRILDGRARKSEDGKARRPARLHRLLTGIARCGVCGAGMRTGTRRDVPLYLCPDGHVSVRLDELDELVVRLVVRLVAQPDVYARLRRAGEASDREVVEARAEVARLTAKLAAARDAWEADRLSLESYIDMEGRLKPAIRAASERAEAAGIDPALRALLDPSRDVAERWAAMPLASQREAVKALMTVRVDKARRVEGRYVPVIERVTLEPR